MDSDPHVTRRRESALEYMKTNVFNARGKPRVNNKDASPSADDYGGLREEYTL
jgi:hypothetical protein